MSDKEDYEAIIKQSTERSNISFEQYLIADRDFWQVIASLFIVVAFVFFPAVIIFITNARCAP